MCLNLVLIDFWDIYMLTNCVLGELPLTICILLPTVFLLANVSLNIFRREKLVCSLILVGEIHYSSVD